MARKTNQLSEKLIDHLKQANVVIIATVGNDGQPALDLLSWLWPMDDKTVRLVISPNLVGGVNLATNGRAALQIIGDELCCEIRGMVRLVKQRCDSVNFPETMYDLTVEEVRENMIPASRLTGVIPFGRNPGTEELHKQLDSAMYAEIQSTPTGT
jgi:hypothetical protein